MSEKHAFGSLLSRSQSRGIWRVILVSVAVCGSPECHCWFAIGRHSRLSYVGYSTLFNRRQKSWSLEYTFLLFLYPLFESYSSIFVINLTSSYYTLWWKRRILLAFFCLWFFFNLLSRLEYYFIIPPLPQCCGWGWQPAISINKSRRKLNGARILTNCPLHPDQCSGT